MKTEEVMGTIKEFGKLAGSQNTQELPVITVNRFTDRTDSTENIVEEINRTGLSKQINLEGNTYLVGSTRAASPHTPISSEKEGQDIPLHYIMWLIKKGYQGVEPSNFSDLVHLPASDRREVLDALGKSTFQTVKEIEDLAEGITEEELLRGLKIYGVVGHTPFSERMETGLSRGPQSNFNPHFHLTVLTPEKLAQSMEKKVASSAEVLKQVSPFDSIFFKATKEAIVRKLQNEHGDILDVAAITDHSKHPEFGGISFFDGYNLKFKNTAEFAEAMDVLTKFIAESQHVYAKVLDFYGDYYQHIAEPEEKKRIAGQCIGLLESFGCTENEATALQKQIFSLSPTFAQVRSWVETKETDEKDQNNKELENILTRYQKHKDLLNNPQQREKIKQGFMRNDLLSGEEADILLTLIEDKLKDPKKGEFSKFTMPGQLSLGYSLDYELKDDRLMVKGITLATRFSEKNIFEDMVGYVLRR